MRSGDWRGPATARSSGSTSLPTAASIGRAARLEEPVLSKALTKFTLPWRWDGQPALLESRVIDETGYVQPTITQLRKQRGTNSVYHNNSIQTWQVKPDGSVFDVQLA